METFGKLCVGLALLIIICIGFILVKTIATVIIVVYQDDPIYFVYFGPVILLICILIGVMARVILKD